MKLECNRVCNIVVEYATAVYDMLATNQFKSVNKAISVLKCFNPQNLELSATEISKRIGIHRVTAHRLLETMSNAGFIEKNENTGKYSIGTALYALGILYLNKIDILRAAEPITKTLNDLTGEAVIVGIFDKGIVVFVMKEESRDAFRFSGNVGSTIPAYASAMGKAFLSELTEAELDCLYPEERLKPIAPKTITTKTDLKRHLEQIRKTGLSFAREESNEGTASVASLIRNARGKAVAAMTIPVQKFKMTEAFRERLSKLIKMGSSLVSYRLGYQDMSNPVCNIEELRSWWEQNQLDSTFQANNSTQAVPISRSSVL